MNDDLEKLDAIRERLDVSYEQAKRALDDAEGDVVQALASLEKSQRDIVSMMLDLADEVSKLLGSEPAKGLRIRLGRRVVADIPVALTAAAGFLLGLAAVVVTKAAIELVKESADGSGRGNEVSEEETASPEESETEGLRKENQGETQ